MHIQLRSLRFPCGLWLAALAGWFCCASMGAEQSCTCSTSQPFGSCVIKKANYADQFPGSALVVESGASKFLYVVDLFSGFTYRYDATKFSAPSEDNPKQIVSARGSQTTTGIAAIKPEVGDTVLYWAVGSALYSSDLEGGNAKLEGNVELVKLAQFLRVKLGDPGIPVGSLGGITFHEGRRSLWGVDIINDVCFEFDLKGRLVLEQGEPRYFASPARNPLTGGAYGNSIAYAAVGGEEFFDLPVGAMTDLRPSEVHRVHATDGEGFRIGDATGQFYVLGDRLGTPKFVTGIAYWPNSCGDGQGSEFLLDIDSEAQTARIIEVSADPPTAANVADFRCARQGDGSVKLTWRKTLPYTNLSIARQLVGTSVTPTVVFENADFANDPQQFVDAVPRGSWEYVATVTAAQAVPQVSCRINVGSGVLVASTVFDAATDAAPYAISVVKSDRVVVADMNSGKAKIYDQDLKLLSTIQCPLVGGLIVGVAYAEVTTGQGTEDRLYWLQNLGGRHWLQPSDLGGLAVGGPLRIHGPSNLDEGIQLGDITYDPSRKVFWTVDLLNASIYAFGLDAKVIEAFKTQQLPSPVPQGVLGGGLAVVATGEQKVLFDVPAGTQAAGFVDGVGRYLYDVSQPASAGLRIQRYDLVGEVGAANVTSADIVSAAPGVDTFEYLVAMDTRGVYKLRVVSGTTDVTLFRRGDTNNDNAVNISDPSYLLEHLFRGGAAPPCAKAADANDSETLDIADAIYVFAYLFLSGPAPAEPFVTCGVDTDPGLACAQAVCSGG